MISVLLYLYFQLTLFLAVVAIYSYAPMSDEVKAAGAAGNTYHWLGWTIVPGLVAGMILMARVQARKDEE